MGMKGLSRKIVNVKVDFFREHWYGKSNFIRSTKFRKAHRNLRINKSLSTRIPPAAMNRVVSVTLCACDGPEFCTGSIHSDNEMKTTSE